MGARPSATGEWDASAVALPDAKPDELLEPARPGAGVEKLAAPEPDAPGLAALVRPPEPSVSRELYRPDVVRSAARSSGAAAPADASQLATISLQCSVAAPEQRVPLLLVTRQPLAAHSLAALLDEPPEQAKMLWAQESALQAAEL